MYHYVFVGGVCHSGRMRGIHRRVGGVLQTPRSVQPTLGLYGPCSHQPRPRRRMQGRGRCGGTRARRHIFRLQESGGNHADPYGGRGVSSVFRAGQRLVTDAMGTRGKGRGMRYRTPVSCPSTLGHLRLIVLILSTRFASAAADSN